MTTEDSTQAFPKTPTIIAILSGGGAVGWMLYLNGWEMFSHWFFYPSLLFLVLTSASLFLKADSKLNRITWNLCMWWSGLWTLVFFVAFSAPPFSMLIVGQLVGPMLEAGRIGPFTAGFLHLLIWACAKDNVKSLNSQPHGHPD